LTDVVTPLHKTAKDVTGALRVRRFRARKKQNQINADVTVDAAFDAVHVTGISTVQMCSLAARIGDGRASREDLRMAERLTMQLVDRLPPDSTIQLPR
jgi:hypothetical protein